jgi:ABC-2 type transport system permease protein
MLAILDTFPPQVIEALDMNAFNLTTLVGFFGVMYLYFALILSIAAGMWGSDIITKEERDKTIEFALTLPVKRETLITAKIAAVVVNCILLALIATGTIVAVVQRYTPDAEFYRFMGLGMLAVFILQLIFMAIGVLLGCAMRRYKRANSTVVSLLLGTYILSVVTDLNKNLEFLKYFSPFKYFDPVLLLRESRFELPFILLSVAIIALCLVGAYLTYARRDLYI